LANQETYYPFFLKVLALYAFVACLFGYLFVDSEVLFKIALIVIFAKAALIGIVMNIAHNWAYNKTYGVQS
jgi:hypothetical protein